MIYNLVKSLSRNVPCFRLSLNEPCYYVGFSPGGFLCDRLPEGYGRV